MTTTHRIGNKPWKFFPESKTKGCTKCERILPFEAFAASTKAKTGLQSACRECVSKMQRAYRAENLSVRRETEAASRAKCHIADKWRHLRRRAEKKNVPVCTRVEFESWHAKQALQCVYCDASESEAVRLYGHRLHVDRIEAPLGYVTGNMQFACHRCNLTKNKYLTHEQMREIAQRYFNP